MHFFLGVGISNLYMTRRGIFRQYFRGGRHPMDAIFAHPATAHDDEFSGHGCFFMAGFSVHG